MAKTATVKTVNVTPPAIPFDQRKVCYTPLAESEEIEITVAMVKNVLAVRSKSHKEPSPADIWRFIMLCKSRQLNPFVNDCYLLGYDTKDGTKWSLITAIQALRKRAEGNPNYRGTECGVIVRDKDNKLKELAGTLYGDDDILVGGWAKVYRQDRTVPAYANVKRTVYDTQQSRWSKDPGGMICKTAEAAALRQAFPSDLAGLYIKDEFENVPDADEPKRLAGIAGLKQRLEDAATDHCATVTVDTSEGVDPPHSDEDAIQDDPKGSAVEMTAEELRDHEGQLFATHPQHD